MKVDSPIFNYRFYSVVKMHGSVCVACICMSAAPHVGGLLGWQICGSWWQVKNWRSDTFHAKFPPARLPVSHLAPQRLRRSVAARSTGQHDQYTCAPGRAPRRRRGGLRAASGGGQKVRMLGLGWMCGCGQRCGRQKGEASNTLCSRAVTHHSTNKA